MLKGDNLLACRELTTCYLLATKPLNTGYASVCEHCRSDHVLSCRLPELAIGNAWRLPWLGLCVKPAMLGPMTASFSYTVAPVRSYSTLQVCICAFQNMPHNICTRHG